MKRLLVLAAVFAAALPVVTRAGDTAGPSVIIELGPRQAQCVPMRQGCHHTGGGNIDVQQPTPDVVVITMTGCAVAVAHPCKDTLASLAFDLTQDFHVCFTNPAVRQAKLSMDARVIGVLRSHKCGGGAANMSPAHAFVLPCGFQGALPAIVEADIPARSVACGDNLSINDKVGPICTVIGPGGFTLRQTFGLQATHPARILPCKSASAEFAPDPALDPLWISYWEPFHGAMKKDFGYQVILRVTACNGYLPNGKSAQP